MGDIIKQLNSFIESNKYKRFASKWLSDENIQVYVRIGHRFIDNEKYDCFDIANVEATKRNKGYFTNFFEQLEKINPPSQFYL